VVHDIFQTGFIGSHFPSKDEPVGSGGQPKQAFVLSGNAAAVQQMKEKSQISLFDWEKT
jgi:hypothetical protein